MRALLRAIADIRARAEALREQDRRDKERLERPPPPDALQADVRKRLAHLEAEVDAIAGERGETR